jgi:chaperonin cofactor prefoldin
MGVIADQLKQLIKEMEESDRRLKELTNQHIADTRKALDELERLAIDD